MSRPTYEVVLDEIERHFHNHRMAGEHVVAATMGGSQAAEMAMMNDNGMILEMGGACALLDMLPLLPLESLEVEIVTRELKRINKIYQHALISNTVTKLCEKRAA